MPYQYENLGPERFQQLCQALLVARNDRVQCFPIGQADGGRDAIIYLETDKNGYAFEVFQVKYVDNPHQETQAHKRLVRQLANELPKVRALIPKGAQSYHVLTNVRGTGALDSGSIDALDRVLRNMGIPAHCWWRDDLDRMLDGSPVLKWQYFEVLTTKDYFQKLVQEGLTEHRERRTATLRAFIRAQYDNDREVRFRQIDLQNDLFDLFVDVPVSVASSARSHPRIDRLRDISARYSEQSSAHKPPVGAAAMLLVEDIPQLVLEGAPGQGKSTVAQYVSQLHRMRILNLDSELERVPRPYQPRSIRLPIKVDLPDLATWLTKRDPFTPKEDIIQGHWEASLEAFLAAQIRHDSGGDEFTVNDLRAVARISALLLVLDGLDEVADIAQRKETVDVVIKGVNRLRTSAASLQVIVTTRPAAFTTFHGFPEDEYPHFALTSLEPPHINRYAEQWIRARRLNPSDGQSVKTILRAKLQEEHIRQLSRNPMQLAILLTLIHNKGVALPDQRTALYDGYVSHFFDRESAKSDIVKTHRELLINIHSYLGWLLHAEAENESSPGRISADRLRVVLTAYSQSLGYEAHLVPSLFTGVTERVVFLVSKVQGAFEFEVQPIREYFAARQLYEFAPQSTPGHESSGTIVDRFDVLARNFYWLNVTRFFAGRWRMAELYSLVDRLAVLANDPEYRHISHPQVLNAMLLSDRVFSQYPNATKAAVRLLMDGVRSGRLLSAVSYGRRSAMALPVDQVAEALLETGVSILDEYPQSDFANEIAELMRANIGGDRLLKAWFARVSKTEGDATQRWFSYGRSLGVLETARSTMLDGLLRQSRNMESLLWPLLAAGRSKYVEGSEEMSRIAVEGMLRGRKCPLVDDSILGHFGIAVRLPEFMLREVLAPGSQTASLRYTEVAMRRFVRILGVKDVGGRAERTSNSVLERCLETLAIAEGELSRPAANWLTRTPWRSVVEQYRELWGERWAFWAFANMSACYWEDDSAYGGGGLADSALPLCDRVAAARSEGSLDWWLEQWRRARHWDELKVVLLLLFSWGRDDVIFKFCIAERGTLRHVSRADLRPIVEAARSVRLLMKQPLKVDGRAGLASLPPAIVAVIGQLLGSDDDKIVVYRDRLSRYRGRDPMVLRFCQEMARIALVKAPSQWKSSLSVIEWAYAHGVVGHGYDAGQMRLPLPAAVEIARHPTIYPRDIVALAESFCQRDIATRTPPVSQVASASKWFLGFAV